MCSFANVFVLIKKQFRKIINKIRSFLKIFLQNHNFLKTFLQHCLHFSLTGDVPVPNRAVGIKKQSIKYIHVRSRSPMHLTFNYLYCEKYQIPKIANPQLLWLIPLTQIRFFLVYSQIKNLQSSLLFQSVYRKSADFSP
jgi:hypothetical protein